MWLWLLFLRYTFSNEKTYMLFETSEVGANSPEAFLLFAEHTSLSCKNHVWKVPSQRVRTRHMTSKSICLRIESIPQVRQWPVRLKNHRICKMCPPVVVELYKDVSQSEWPRNGLKMISIHRLLPAVCGWPNNRSGLTGTQNTRYWIKQLQKSASLTISLISSLPTTSLLWEY